MRRARWCVVPSLVLSGLTGCLGTSGTADESFEDGGLDALAVDASPGVDTGASSDGTLASDTGTGSDTGPASGDTGTAPTDTGTAPTDTGTAPTDTGTAPTDTGTTPTDTGTTPTDTGTTPTDTGTPPTDTGPVAELSCSLTSGPTSGNVDLNAGTLDWAHWGLFNKDSWDHKSGGAFFASKGSTKGSVGQFGAYPISWTWSSGAPTATMVVPSFTGIYVNKKDEGFAFDVAASPAGQTLVVWLSRSDATASVKVTSSDAGIAAYATTISGSGGSIVPATLTCKVRGATSSSKVTVEIQQTTGGYTSLLSAAVKSL
ncbi:MAG: hypothetical protein JNL79_33565 [Myxococcales bacterium]|nr:hypothetical protein [Myxococcales bacterium]